MGLNRRAIFFSLTAFILLAVIAIVLSVALRTPAVDTNSYTVLVAQSDQRRLESHYLPLVLRYTSDQTLIAMTYDAANANIYLSLPGDFANALKNGSYQGRPLTAPQIDTRLSELINASNDSYSLTIWTGTPSITQTAAFEARVSLPVSYNLTSLDGMTRYRRSVIVNATVSLQGLTDVSYVNKMRALGSPEMRSIYPYTGKPHNNTGFLNWTAQKQYVADTAAPSVFSRLQGNLTLPSIYGIETIIPNATVPPDNLTSIDYQYLAYPTNFFNCTYQMDENTNTRFTFETAVSFNITNATNVQGNPLCPILATWP